VDDEDGAELLGGVGAQPLGHLAGRHALPVRHLEAIHLDAVRGGGAAEVVREMAVDDAQGAVAGGQRVDDGRLPAADPGYTIAWPCAVWKTVLSPASTSDTRVANFGPR
jgi:hypothetical protein